ncbi:MAG: hypothetical protein JXR34_06530 [Bacteroidales bacterium]|nr:hypothetical protein [Bacteroidales bacterium]
MENQIKIQDRLFCLISSFFGVEVENQTYYFDLAYEADGDHFVNRISTKANDLVQNAANQANGIMDWLLGLLYVVFPIYHQEQLALVMSYDGGESQMSGWSNVKNYGNFYTRKNAVKIEDDEGFKLQIIKILERVGLMKKYYETQEKPQFHRAGKMYRGHSLDE